MRFSSHSTADRFWASFLALFLAYFFVLGPIRQVWKDHWLVKDRQQGSAMVVKENWAGHDVVVYEYRAGQNVYTGQDRRNRRGPKYANVRPGEKTVVYYSASHPWISSFDPPDTVMIDGLPVVLLVWLIELGLVITVINPESKWALSSKSQQRDLPAQIAKSRPDGVTDFLRLIGTGILIVVAMTVIEISINLLFGRR
ncbi:MAG TPA: hypothetical protein VGS27_31570 [Candidatus Sulfotelmatobacter sp.]|nr:hypothetical protein [Candidatus Sulfotelmatobacter sp.]